MSRSRNCRRTSTAAHNREYWSRRPFSNQHGATPGRIIKTLTHRKERRIAERELRREAA